MIDKFSDVVKKDRKFSKNDDNPLIYTLVLAKLANSDKETLKNDEILFNALNKVEDLAKNYDTSSLEKSFSPMRMTAVFNKDSVKKSLPEYLNQYYNEFEKELANHEKSFDKAYEIHRSFDKFRSSDEFSKFVDSL